MYSQQGQNTIDLLPYIQQGTSTGITGTTGGTTSGSTSLSDILAQGKDFINQGSQSVKIDEGSLANTFIPIARILVAIGTVVLVVVTAIMGIQYMVASPDEKAKLKVKLVGLVVSTIVIFGAQTIWSTLYKFFNSL